MSLIYELTDVLTDWPNGQAIQGAKYQKNGQLCAHTSIQKMSVTYCEKCTFLYSWHTAIAPNLTQASFP